MSTPKIERFPPSEVVLRLPMAACEHLVMSGLSAAQMRLALVLTALCHQGNGVVIVEKPRLEQLTGITLTSVTKLLAPLMQTTIDIPGHELHGEHVFEGLEYDGGKKGQVVGRIRASLTIAMEHYLSKGRSSPVELPADEMRQYASVGAIILRMRLGAAFASQKSSVRATISITPPDVSAIFGSYGRIAVIKRPSTKTGEIVEKVALSRAGTMLIEPAVNEINEQCRSMRLKSTALLDGRRAVKVIVDATRIEVRTTAPKPVRKVLHPIVRGRPTRAVVKSVDA